MNLLLYPALWDKTSYTILGDPFSAPYLIMCHPGAWDFASQSHGYIRGTRAQQCIMERCQLLWRNDGGREE